MPVVGAAGFPDLRDEARDAGVSQAAVGSQMGYRPDEFSRVMRGHQPPKAGMTPEEFRRRYRSALRALKSGRGGAQ